MSWLVQPGTKVELPAIPGERPPARNTAAHLIPVYENGIPVRMSFRFCDDPECCPALPAQPAPKE